MLVVPIVQAGTLVGVAFGSPGLASVPTNWQLAWAPYLSDCGNPPTTNNCTSNPGNLALINLISETGALTPYSLTVTVTDGSDWSFRNDFTGNPQTNTVPVHTPSLGVLDGVLAGETVAGRYETLLTATFSGLAPGQVYDVYAFGLSVKDSGFPNNIDQNVTITSATGTISFSQIGPASAGAQLFINGSVGNSSQPLEDFAIPVVPDANGDIAITFQAIDPGSGGNLFLAGGVALEAVPEPGTWLLVGFGVLGLAGSVLTREFRAAR